MEKIVLQILATPWGGIGLSVCYDLRFPYLYRALARAGARYLARIEDARRMIPALQHDRGFTGPEADAL